MSKPRFRQTLQAAEGYQLNPLLRYPFNFQCFCGAGKKYRYCCFKKVETTYRFILEAEADKLKDFMKHIQKNEVLYR